MDIGTPQLNVAIHVMLLVPSVLDLTTPTVSNVQEVTIFNHLLLYVLLHVLLAIIQVVTYVSWLNSVTLLVQHAQLKQINLSVHHAALLFYHLSPSILSLAKDLVPLMTRMFLLLIFSTWHLLIKILLLVKVIYKVLVILVQLSPLQEQSSLTSFLPQDSSLTLTLCLLLARSHLI